MPQALDLTGAKYGRLTGVRRVENKPGYGQARWLFRCECGTEKVLFGYSVVHGKVLSCGCWNRESLEGRLVHGMCRTIEFNSWTAMRQRCTNPKSKAYPHYGGRGITICHEWETFEAFYRDMGPRPDGMTLDRINNDKGYGPDNCRWATPRQQVGNRRTTTFYEHDGEKLSLQEWAVRIGVPYQTLWHRHKIGKRGTDLLSPKVGAGGRPRTKLAQQSAA